MACQIKLSANIVNQLDIRTILFPFESTNGGENWLNSCEISLSPCGDLLILAHDKRLLVLTGKWDAGSSLTNFYDSCSLKNDQNDVITSVLCLPVVSHGQTSSQVGPDWTCIAVGFQSGYIRFYTEDCMLLLEEQFHNEAVISIKCQSQHSPRPDITGDLKPEEIYVQYSTNICVINGQNLFVTLRNCRSYLAKGVKNISSPSEALNIAMNPKKWGFVEQNNVADASVVGLDLSNTFDHLLTASTCGGFDTKYRAVPPNNNLVIGVGNKPYVGFHYALEGGAQPVLSDVAKALANKVKSALPGWLTGTKTTVDKQSSVTLLPSESMACRFGLCDLRRVATNVILSPDKKLAAISDSLGRVILVDTHKGIALRIFKGYREAQCAFIQVPDERKSKSRTKAIALFLIIYSPKKGTLEIFLTQLGTKIATFTASKNSKLLYANYGLMGFQSMSKSRFICQYATTFIDPDGSIKEIIIPFHFALSESNSKRARDMHLYKRLKQFAKTGNYNEEELLTECFNTCSELKTAEVKLQLIEFLSNNKSTFPEIIFKCCNYFIEKISVNNVAELEPDLKSLKILCENLCSLVNFFVFVHNNNDEDNNGNNVSSGKVVDTTRVLSEKDMANLQKLLDLSTINNFKSPVLKVSFQDNGHDILSNFIKIFNLNDIEHISLKTDVEETLIFQTAKVIFEKYVLHHFDSSILKINLKSSRILIDDLFHLLLVYWENRALNIDINLENQMENFSSIVYALAENAISTEVVVDYNQISPFWATIRSILMNSSRSFPALMAAIICKNVAQRIEDEVRLEKSEDDFEVWEDLSKEACEWILLIGKLEDVSLLNIILSNEKNKSVGDVPILKHEKEVISLKYVLQRGKGSVSELVAKWLTSSGLNPRLLPLNDQIINLNSFDENQSKDNINYVEIYGISEEDYNRVKSEKIFEQFNILKKQFPYSLESDVLLANMCWEYAIFWQRDLEKINLLEACIRCISEIKNPKFKTGVYQIFWNTHLKQLFEIVCKLINKVGKLPKERLCRQDTALSDTQITQLTKIGTEFFDGFIISLEKSDESEDLILHHEPIWEEETTLPLSKLALNHSNANYDLVLLHYQISMCLYMMTTFQIKHTKFINNLFDPLVIPLCFIDLQQKVEISWHKSESKTNNSRMNFLMKLILATIETITVSDDNIYFTDHITWMGRCIKLARLWNLEVDKLRQYQVTHLYINGFDSLGEELILAVTDLGKLGPELLKVVGKRLQHQLSLSEVLGEKITAFSTAVTQYISTLDSDWCAPSTLPKIQSLISNCLRCFNEDQIEYELASLMMDTCDTLQQLQN
ncbi:rab3 GTPase-activating protein non-catalytic subunit [Onthophagus taurus]|uniref:rab3 GTPase-activating protein non-catalytic subunit n=1 Tax=Onthophagus taurus TaxID=166361 RepID=UPI0039BE1D12